MNKTEDQSLRVTQRFQGRRFLIPSTAMKTRPNVRAENAATALRRSVTRLARRLRLERADHGVSASKLIALGHLLRRGAMTAKELAALEHVQPQSLTRIVAELEEGELIHRDQGKTDRREVQIKISAKGRDLLVLDARRQDAWLNRAIAEALTDAERDILTVAARLLDSLSDAPTMPEAKAGHGRDADAAIPQGRAKRSGRVDS
jgi:DNA-binding MarR family transcriptional regulator